MHYEIITHEVEIPIRALKYASIYEIVVKADKEHLYEKVFDNKNNQIGKIIKILGPVSSPYESLFFHDISVERPLS